jgi:hypothetical protein
MMLKLRTNCWHSYQLRCRETDAGVLPYTHVFCQNQQKQYLMIVASKDTPPSRSQAIILSLHAMHTKQPRRTHPHQQWCIHWAPQQ